MTIYSLRLFAYVTVNACDTSHNNKKSVVDSDIPLAPGVTVAV